MQVCEFYQKRRCFHGDKCKKKHVDVCMDFQTNDCKNSTTCKLAHFKLRTKTASRKNNCYTCGIPSYNHRYCKDCHMKKPKKLKTYATPHVVHNSTPSGLDRSQGAYDNTNFNTNFNANFNTNFNTNFNKTPLPNFSENFNTAHINQDRMKLMGMMKESPYTKYSYQPDTLSHQQTYRPDSPTYQPDSPTYQPDSPTYQPDSPTYQPSSTSY